MESLGLDWKVFLAQIVNFGILLFVLKKVLYKPLMKLLDERNKAVNQAVTNSQTIENKLKKIEEEEQKLLDRAKQRAKKEREELMEIANEEKEKIINEAKLSAKREVEKGLESLESAKKEAVSQISDEYMEKVADKLFQRFNKSAKKEKYPLLRSLLK